MAQLQITQEEIDNHLLSPRSPPRVSTCDEEEQQNFRMTSNSSNYDGTEHSVSGLSLSEHILHGEDLYRILISHLRDNAAANYDEIESSVSGQPTPQQGMAVIAEKNLYEILESYLPHATEDQLDSYVNDLGDFLDQLEDDLTAKDGEDLYRIVISHLRDKAAANYDEIKSSVSGQPSPQKGMVVITQKDLYEILESHLPHATEDQLNSYVNDLGDYLDQLEADLTAMDRDGLSEEADQLESDQIAMERDGLSEENFPESVRSGTCQDGDFQDVCMVCQSEYERNETLGTLECGHEYHQQMAVGEGFLPCL